MANGRRRLTPVSEEDKRKVTRESLKQTLEIFAFIKPYLSSFIFGLVFLVLSTGTTFVFITFLKDLIDPAVDQVEGWENQLKTIAIYLSVILIAQAFFSFMRIYLFAQVSERALADIRMAVYRKLISLRLSFFEERRVGELTSRITSDVSQLQNAMSVTLAEFLRQIFTFIIGIVILFGISVKLTFVMIASFPLTIIIAIFIGRYIRKVSKKSQDSLADANVVAEETLQSIQVVKAFANELLEVFRYSKKLDEVVMYALKAANARGVFVVFLITAVFGGITLVIWFGASLIGTGDIKIGDLIYFVMITLFIGGSIAGLGDLYGQLQRTIGASERIRDILREKEEITLPERRPAAVERLEGDIQFHEVAFSYPTRPEMTVLRDVNVEIASGEKIALVGHSGAGKSTMSRILLGFYPTMAGEVLLDGRPLHQIGLETLRRNVGIVPQEVILFGGTIRENIGYGNPEADERAIISAAQMANAWEFIQDFPEQLDTVVGDRGIKLSGGQRQRVAIARAILKDPSILLLDEATSSLDAESEHLVQQALYALMEGRTTIIIAHRLSTIRKVDRIYVLDKGQIIESGSHQELSLKEGGAYKKLLQLQLEST
ncbi:MAG: ABC transporter transmembrane domain-containing protein [Bacteroidota bacterium]